jgi:starch synthase
MGRDVCACYPSVDPARVHVIHNGIDAGEYHPDPGTDALSALGVDPDRRLVAYVGRITRQKGLPHLLRAAPSLDRSAELVLFASAPDTAEIAAEVRDLYEAARSAGVSIVWIEAAVPRATVIQLLSHAAAFVCPSVYEPFGLVNLEAMACGAAVVASAVGGIPEIVVDGETGYLVPGPAETGGAPSGRHFEADLADRINQLVADPVLAADMGRAGRRRVLERFSWEAVATQTIDLYESLLTRVAP